MVTYRSNFISLGSSSDIFYLLAVLLLYISGASRKELCLLELLAMTRKGPEWQTFKACIWHFSTL